MTAFHGVGTLVKPMIVFDQVMNEGVGLVSHDEVDYQKLKSGLYRCLLCFRDELRVQVRKPTGAWL